MATLTPGRFYNVANAADHITLVEANFEILTEELFKLTPTFQNGVPNTLVGPPVSGARVLNELWRDAWGGLFLCTAAGTPGTWRQILPAVVAAPPGSGTVPVGYLVVDMGANGVLKRHTGSYVWAPLSLPVAGGTLDDGANVAVGTATGTKLGTAASQKLGLWGATPVVQPAGAAQAAVTLGNTDGEIAALAFSATPTQVEVVALRDKCEELADDVRALSGLVHALRTALVAAGVIKGGA